VERLTRRCRFGRRETKYNFQVRRFNVGVRKICVRRRLARGRYGESRLSPQSMTEAWKHRKRAHPRIAAHRIDLYYTIHRPRHYTVDKDTLTSVPNKTSGHNSQPWPQQLKCLPRPSQRHLLLVSHKASTSSSPPSQDSDSPEHSPSQSHQTRQYATFFTPSTLASLQMSTQP
jgi:hypothetical protein